MGRKKKVVTAKVPVGDEGATQPENKETSPTNISEETAEQSRAVTAERLPGVFGEGDDEDEPEVAERTFKTIARSLEELSIASIRHFDLIPDFVIPTTAEHPIIVRTGEGNFCIDGWELVEAAKSEGKPSILCEVDELNIHSDEEICLRKGGIRSLTRGGISTYPEMIRNTGDLLAMLLSSDEDLRIYGHGECRYGVGFVGNKEEDVRHILAMRLGRDRDTVNLYLCHGEYLSGDALQFLIDHQAPKEFFVRVQVKKRTEIKNQKGKKNFSVGRITTAISKFIIEEFEKYLADREAEKSKKSPKSAPSKSVATSKKSAPTEDEKEEVDDDSDPEEGAEDPTPASTTDEPITLERIFSTYHGVSKRMAEDVSKGISIPEMKDRLKEELKMIMKILDMIDSISGTEK